MPRTALTYGLYGDSVWVVKEGRRTAAAPADCQASPCLAVAADAAPTGSMPAQPKLTVERRFVRVGPSEGDRVAILEGLQGGRAGRDQRPAQAAARRRRQDRQFASALSRRPSGRSNRRPMAFTDLFIRRPVLATRRQPAHPAGRRAWRPSSCRCGSFPRLSNTTITITTTYPGANADLIKGFITDADPAGGGERRGHRHAGLDLAAERHRPSRSICASTPIPDRAMADVLSKVNQVQGLLPREAQRSGRRQADRARATRSCTCRSTRKVMTALADHRLPDPRRAAAPADHRRRRQRADPRRPDLRHAHLARPDTHGVARRDAARRARRARRQQLHHRRRPGEGRLRPDQHQRARPRSTTPRRSASWWSRRAATRWSASATSPKIELGPQSVDSSSVFDGLKAVFIGIYAHADGQSADRDRRRAQDHARASRASCRRAWRRRSPTTRPTSSAPRSRRSRRRSSRRRRSSSW